MFVDLNCDMGEGSGNDAAIMPFISSANIACGYHAGNEATMQETVSLAMQHNVAIGAHPSYPDRDNFGRIAMNLSAQQIYSVVLEQIQSLNKIAQEQGAQLHHIKPHGALYNRAAIDRETADAIVNAVADFNRALIIYGLANSQMIKASRAKGIQYMHEVFADRTYQSDGTLTPRSQSNAIIESTDEAWKQVWQMVQHKTVTTVDRTSIPIQADTICIHGDGVHALAFAHELNNRLLLQGIKIKS